MINRTGEDCFVPKYGKYDRRLDISYACGAFPSLELLKRRPEHIRALLLSSDSGMNSGAVKLKDACLERGIYVETAPRAIERICGKENCSAVAVFSKYESFLAKDEPHIVLHNISDAGNFGTILRTALGFGFRDVAVIKPCVDVFSPQAVRASMGALFSINVRAYENFDEYENNFPAHRKYFFRLKNAASLHEAAIEGLPSLVFGNESAGLPENLLARETGVCIHHGAEIDSLNLAVAAGIGIAHFSNKLGINQSS
ncbi:MAG: TrmH family RNA methyltransferase [Christensenellales bacterium]|jgi:TrmH family RNA methyltransferase